MKIESIIQRHGGSEIDLGSKKYSFDIQPDGAHVAEVGDKDHIARLLAIPEGFRIYDTTGNATAALVIEEKTYKDGTKATGPSPLPEESPAISLLGSNVHPATFDINGKTYQLGEVVALAHAASGMAADEWNELEGDTRADLIDEELEKLAAIKQPEGDDLEALKEQYKAKFGKAPHYKWDAARIREAIEA